MNETNDHKNAREFPYVIISSIMCIEDSIVITTIVNLMMIWQSVQNGKHILHL